MLMLMIVLILPQIAQNSEDVVMQSEHGVCLARLGMHTLPQQKAMIYLL